MTLYDLRKKIQEAIKANAKSMGECIGDTSKFNMFLFSNQELKNIGRSLDLEIFYTESRISQLKKELTEADKNDSPLGQQYIDRYIERRVKAIEELTRVLGERE